MMKYVLGMLLMTMTACGGDSFIGCDAEACKKDNKVCGTTVAGTDPATGKATVGVGCVDPPAK
jgi:hypothetical protein